MTESGLREERLAYLDLMREIEDFFFKEADLLDEREYDQWLDLLTEDIVYWMPMRKNVSYADRHKDITAENDVAWFHDDKDTLRKRVKQIQTGIHWADEPISRISTGRSSSCSIEPSHRTTFFENQSAEN